MLVLINNCGSRRSCTMYGREVNHQHEKKLTLLDNNLRIKVLIMIENQD
jgi:hypothetical protein